MKDEIVGALLAILILGTLLAMVLLLPFCR